jgi:hypothetical protein
MNLQRRSDDIRARAFVEMEVNEGGNPYGGGRLVRVSLSAPRDPKLRHVIMPAARVGGAPSEAASAQEPPRAIVVAEVAPKVLKWLQEQPAPLTTNQIADHPDMPALVGKKMSRASMHNVLSKMLDQGLVARYHDRVEKRAQRQSYAGKACFWSAAK